MPSPQLQQFARGAHWRQESRAGNGLPLLENASSPLYILHGERLPTQGVEECRFELDEGRQIVRFGSPYRSADEHGDFSARNKPRFVAFPKELYSFRHVLRQERRHRAGWTERERTSRASEGNLAADFFKGLSGQGLLQGLAFLNPAPYAANRDFASLTPPFGRLLELKEESVFNAQKDCNAKDHSESPSGCRSIGVKTP